MSYLTALHYEELASGNKYRLISGYYRLGGGIRLRTSAERTLQKRFSGYSWAVLMCALLLSGCTSEHSSDQAKQEKDSKENTIIKPGQKEVGEASWYGPGFQGRETASGATFDQKKLTAAHPTLPLGTKAQVTNLENNKKVEVTINDRGPYVDDRAIDLSRAAAKKLGMVKDGTTEVKIETKPVKKKKSSAKSQKTQ
ncbi:MAG: septal ring lytic transglycosylase RlpA family protein [Methylobacter sp.]